MDQLTEYSKRLEFEHNLINNRITWLLVSQSLLFNAYAEAISKDSATVLLGTIAVVGIFVSALVMFGIGAAIAAKVYAWTDLKRHSEYAGQPLGVRTPITIIGFVPELMMPIAFCGAWWYVLWACG